MLISTLLSLEGGCRRGLYEDVLARQCWHALAMATNEVLSDDLALLPPP
jgi:hypothetical protein